jgi:hypothetical protein
VLVFQNVFLQIGWSVSNWQVLKASLLFVNKNRDNAELEKKIENGANSV